MHWSNKIAFSLLLGAAALPSPAASQITVRFGARLGPELSVFAYSPERHGDWRTNYRRWTPVTLYDINGHYYQYQVAGARPVQVYRYNNQYFLPPRDQAWVDMDRRFNSRYRPGDNDYGRVQPPPADWRFDARFGSEVGVLNYSPERQGDWHVGFRRWTPVTLYEYNGHYYQRNGPGSRAVTVYRFGDEYFLPPRDPQWRGQDRRWNSRPMPDDNDYGRVRVRP